MPLLPGRPGTTPKFKQSFRKWLESILSPPSLVMWAISMSPLAYLRNPTPTAKIHPRSDGTLTVHHLWWLQCCRTAPAWSVERLRSERDPERSSRSADLPWYVAVKCHQVHRDTITDTRDTGYRCGYARPIHRAPSLESIRRQGTPSDGDIVAAKVRPCARRNYPRWSKGHYGPE
jgi:hypothetical protein